MRKIRVIVGLSLVFHGIHSYGQTPVVTDPGLTAATITSGILQNNRLEEMKDKQSSIERYQLMAVSQLTFINKWQEKLYKGLSEVSAGVRDIKHIIEAKTVVEGIIKYQTLVAEYAKDDPLLMIFAARTEANIKAKAVELISYIQTVALAGGEKNLMDAAERAELINHVLHELRLIRGLSYSAQRQMYWAKMDGVFRKLNPFATYVNQDKKIANDILRNFKF